MMLILSLYPDAVIEFHFLEIIGHYKRGNKYYHNTIHIYFDPDVCLVAVASLPL